jgi:hypothetical protein
MEAWEAFWAVSCNRTYSNVEWETHERGARILGKIMCYTRLFVLVMRLFLLPTLDHIPHMSPSTLHDTRY